MRCETTYATSDSFMIPIYVIALESSHDRRQNMTNRLADIGLEFSFIDAVVGKTIPAEEHARLTSATRQNYYPSPMSAGALGCLLSHRNAWQKLLDSKADMALVLEDDAMLVPEIVPILERIKRLKGRFDIISLERRLMRPLVDIAQLSETHRLTHTQFNNSGATGYIITPKAAHILLERSIPAIYEVDVLMNRWWDHGLSFLITQPALVQEDDLESTIGYPSKKTTWPEDRLTHEIKRRFHRFLDSMAKRRSFGAMVATAKMRLMGTNPNETGGNPSFPNLIKMTNPDE